MRYLINCCFLLCVCVNFSCSDKDVTAPANITGTWELHAYYNGFTGKTELVTDSIRQIVFTNTTYQNFTNDLLLQSGTYELVTETSFISGKTGDIIIYDNIKNNFRTFVTVSHDSLTFSDDAYDGGGSLYIRH